MACIRGARLCHRGHVATEVVACVDSTGETSALKRPAKGRRLTGSYGDQKLRLDDVSFAGTNIEPGRV